MITESGCAVGSAAGAADQYDRYRLNGSQASSVSLGAAGDKNHIVNFLDHKCSFKDCRWQCFVNFFKKTNRTRVRCLFVHIFGPDSEVQKRRADILVAQAHIFRFSISAVTGGARTAPDTDADRPPFGLGRGAEARAR